MSATPQEIDAVFVRIYAKADEYTKGMAEVVKTADAVEKKLVDFAAKVTTTSVAAFSSIQQMVASSAASFATSFASMGADVSAFVGVLSSIPTSFVGSGAALTRFATHITNITTAISSGGLAAPLGRFIKKLGDLAVAVAALPDSFTGTSGMLTRFTTRIVKLSAAIESLPNSFTGSSAALTRFTTRITSLAGVMNSVVTDITAFVAAIVSVPAGFAGTSAVITRFTTKLTALGVELATIPAGFTQPSAAITRFTSKITALATAIKGIIGDIVAFTAGVGAVAGSFTGTTAAMTKFSAGISGMAAVMTATTPAVAGFTTAIGSLPSSFAGTSAPLTRFTTRISALATAMSKMAADATVFQTSLVAITGSFSGLAPSIKPVTSAVSRLGSSFARLAVVDMATASANTVKMIALLNQFNSIPPQTLKVVSAVGSSLGAMARYMKQAAISGATLPPIVNNITNAFPGAGQGAKTLSTRFRDLFTSATSAGSGLASLKMSLAGLAGFGIYAFAKLDDDLTRVMANMRDFDQVNKPVFRGGVENISGASRTGAVDLAKGLDVLASSGMNAAFAVKALESAETFAVAGGMHLGDATARLVEIQRNLDLNMESPEEHLKQMAMLGDVFAGMAPRMQSTAQQLTEAFGSRFLGAIHYHNISLAEAISLQGMFSAAGIKGSEASDRASRFLREMTRSNVENTLQWQQLGINVYDSANKMKSPIAILEQLENVLGKSGMHSDSMLSALSVQNRAIDALRPLIGKSGLGKQFMDTMDDMGGSMKQMADMMRQSFTGQMMRLWNNFTNVARSIGDVIAPAIAVLADKIESLLKSFGRLNPAVRSFLIWTGLILGTVGPVIAILGTVGSVLAQPFVMLGTALVFITPLLPIVTAVMVGIVALGPVWVASFGLAAAVMGRVLGYIHGVNKALWEGSIPAFRAFLDSVETMFGRIGAGGGTIDLDALFGGMKLGLDSVAGFFWNFQENVSIIYKWLGRNWKDLIVDMINMVMVFTENMLKNITMIGDFLIKAGVSMWSTFVSIGMEYIWAFGSWIADFFLTLGKNIGHNLGVAFQQSLIAAQLNLPKILGGHRPESIIRGEMKDALKEGRGEQHFKLMKELWDRQDAEKKLGLAALKFREPMEGIGGQTYFNRLMKIAGSQSGEHLSNMGTYLQEQLLGGGDSKGLLKSLNTPLAGFASTITEALKLNLDLPKELEGSKMMEWMRKFDKPVPEDMPGLPFHKGGAGFQFKQISQERTMLGGPVNEMLDYQQLTTLQAMDRKLAVIANIIQAREGSPLFMGPPKSLMEE
jgi:TP901 family phage tail tape measure protein